MVMLVSVPPIGQRIKDLRQQRGWTQEDLAREADVKRSWVGLVESGGIPSPGAKNLDKIAKAFGVDSRFLLTTLDDDDRVDVPLPAGKVVRVTHLAGMPDWILDTLVPIADTMLKNAPKGKADGEEADSRDGERP